MPGTFGTRTARHTSRSRFASIAKGPIVSVIVFPPPLASTRGASIKARAARANVRRAFGLRSVDMDVPPLRGRYTERREDDKDSRAEVFYAGCDGRFDGIDRSADR